MAAFLAGTCAAGAAAAPAPDARALGRAGGGDRATAVRVAQALLAHPLDVVLNQVRCEAFRTQHFCGIVLSGVKFHRALDLPAFQRDVDALIAGAFAADAGIAEVDLWVTVPANAGKGAIVSGDFAQPTSATVFAVTATRARAAHASTSADAFWDPAFRAELVRGVPA